MVVRAGSLAPGFACDLRDVAAVVEEVLDCVVVVAFLVTVVARNRKVVLADGQLPSFSKFPHSKQNKANLSNRCTITISAPPPTHYVFLLTELRSSRLDFAYRL